jgi:hypothetical protein
MIWKLILILAATIVLVGSVYVEVHQRKQGVLDTVKPQQVPAMHSAKTIRDYQQ